MPSLRLMTYNVHACVGPDGRDSAAAIAAVVAGAQPDVVALQELEAPARDDDDGPHHARDIARGLGMTVAFCRTLARGARGHYGHALLSRHPLELRRSATLPLEVGPRAEPRGAIWAVVRVGASALHVVSTHLGLGRRERARQASMLLGEEWAGHPEFQARGVVCGDLNAAPPGVTFRRFARALVDAQRAAPAHRPRPTFPSRFPVLRLDHVFVTRGVRVAAAAVLGTPEARRASDHLPLVVDLEWAA